MIYYTNYKLEREEKNIIELTKLLPELSENPLWEIAVITVMSNDFGYRSAKEGLNCSLFGFKNCRFFICAWVQQT